MAQTASPAAWRLHAAASTPNQRLAADDARSPSSSVRASTGSYRSPTKWTNFEDSDADESNASRSPKPHEEGTAGRASSTEAEETRNLLDEAEGASEPDDDPFAMSDDQRAYYRSCFVHLQQQTDGRLDEGGAVRGADEAVVQFFSKSNLARDVLSRIWQLADVNEDGFLNLHEFSVAMHLIVLRVKGDIAVPDELPATIRPPTTPPRKRSDATPVESAKQPPSYAAASTADPATAPSPKLREFSGAVPGACERPVAVKLPPSDDEWVAPAGSVRRASTVDYHQTAATATSVLALSPPGAKGPPPAPPPRPIARGHARSASLDLGAASAANGPTAARRQAKASTLPPARPPPTLPTLLEAATQTDGDATDMGLTRRRQQPPPPDRPMVELDEPAGSSSAGADANDWASRCERLRRANADLERERASLAADRLRLELRLQALTTNNKTSTS